MAQSSPRSSSGKAPARPRTKAGASQAGAPKGSSSRAPGAPEPAQPGFLARFFAAVARAGAGAVGARSISFSRCHSDKAKRLVEG